MTECETSGKWHLRRSGGLDSRPPGIAGCSGCQPFSCGYWPKSNGLRPGQRPGGRRYGLPLSWGFPRLGSCFRGRPGDKIRNASAFPQVIAPAPHRVKIAQAFEFMPLNSAPGRIRTCAHGSGEGCPVRR
jgi:hypothetical protein